MTSSCIPAESGNGTCGGPPDTNGFLLLSEAPGRPTKTAMAVAISVHPQQRGQRRGKGLLELLH